MSEPTATPTTVADMARELSLETITYYEIGAKLREDPESTDLTEVEGQVETNSSWQLRIRNDEGGIGYRVRVETEAPLGTMVVDIAAEYTWRHPVDLNPEAVYGYANERVVSQLYPFIREAVLSLSGRVFGKGLIVPLLTADEITFEPGESVSLEMVAAPQ